MRLSIGEIFQQAAALEGDARGEFLRKHWTPTLGTLIQVAFEPAYEFDLPEGTPPYKKNDLDDQESNLYAEIRRLYVFFKPHPNINKHGGHVPAMRKEMMWIQLLENVSQLDAETLLEIREGRLPNGFKMEEIKQIFPGLLSANAVDGPEPEQAKPDEPVAAPAPAPAPAPVPVKKKPAAKKKKPAAKKKAPAKKRNVEAK